MKKVRLLVVFYILFQNQSVVLADIGPKPAMCFTIHLEFSRATSLRDYKPALFKCNLQDCSDAKPVEYRDLAFSCMTDSSCTAMGLGPNAYYKMTFKHDGKTVESRVFNTLRFQTHFDIRFRDDEIIVVETNDKVDIFKWVTRTIDRQPIEWRET